MGSRARARANIALVKYWGKSDTALNVPAVGSISVTLDALWSETEVEFDGSLPRDAFLLDGVEDEAQRARVSRCLDVLRERAGAVEPARVVSRNSFPTGAGLASSASGFAALVCAAADALGLDLSPTELSVLARRGSGSAARSVFGGYVEMHAGIAADGSDSYAEPLLAPADWPLAVVIAVTATAAKSTGSTDGMQSSAQTSPYYAAWVESSGADLEAARRAIHDRDFSRLAQVSEHSCLKLHALAITSRPPLIYWNPATVACIETVRSLRSDGVPVCFTIDAGPQLKALCEPEAAAQVAEALRAVDGVRGIIVSGLGQGVERLTP